jgi:hypothetical protein
VPLASPPSYPTRHDTYLWCNDQRGLTTKDTPGHVTPKWGAPTFQHDHSIPLPPFRGNMSPLFCRGQYLSNVTSRLPVSCAASSEVRLQPKKPRYISSPIFLARTQSKIAAPCSDAHPNPVHQLALLLTYFIFVQSLLQDAFQVPGPCRPLLFSPTGLGRL